MKAAIGIDVGSSSAKGVLYAPGQERVLAADRAGLPEPVLGAISGHHEMDPVPIREVVESMLMRLSAEARDRGVEVSGVAFTGQMHGGMVVSADGEPLTPFVTWQDKRGDEPLEPSDPASPRLVEALHQRVPADSWQGIGCRLYTGYLGATLYWYLSRDRLPVGAHCLQGIYDWVAATVCGVPSFTDPSSAAAWGLWSIRDASWCDDVVDAIGLPRELLPRVVPSGEVAGTLSSDAAERFGLPVGLPVVSGIGDTQATYLGSTCRPDELVVNFGTGSQLMWACRKFPALRLENPPGASPSSRAGAFHVDPHTDVRYLPGGRVLTVVPTLAGGRAYAILADFFADVVQCLVETAPSRDEVFEVMDRQAASIPPGAEGVRFKPLFNGSRFDGEELRAEISGLVPATLDMAHLCRALLDGMTEELAEPYFALPLARRAHRGMVGAGYGLRRNATLCQEVQRRFEMSLRFGPFEDEAAVGTAMLAAGAEPASASPTA